ncbi:hypothetical protein PBOI14_68640 [Pseudomonas sp. Boi14]|nr:hypothetical protein PBOI14_68640 [Pseudomonas sp. Boi14]
MQKHPTDSQNPWLELRRLTPARIALAVPAPACPPMLNWTSNTPTPRPGTPCTCPSTTPA